jgi:hypothetical protein
MEIIELTGDVLAVAQQLAQVVIALRPIDMGGVNSPFEGNCTPRWKTASFHFSCRQARGRNLTGTSPKTDQRAENPDSHLLWPQIFRQSGKRRSRYGTCTQRF